MLSAISHFSPDISAYTTAPTQQYTLKNEPTHALETGTEEGNHSTNNGLSQEELAQVEKLKQRDAEVKAHEQAHLSAAGGIATSGASFSFERGPDGQRYAVGGEVQIDTSGVSGDPAATLSKADTIKRAALAPASPSSQDFKVAAQASSMAAKAQAELLKMEQENANPTGTKESIGTLFDQAA